MQSRPSFLATLVAAFRSQHTTVLPKTYIKTLRYNDININTKVNSSIEGAYISK